MQEYVFFGASNWAHLARFVSFVYLVFSLYTARFVNVSVKREKAPPNERTFAFSLKQPKYVITASVQLCVFIFTAAAAAVAAAELEAGRKEHI